MVGRIKGCECCPRPNRRKVSRIVPVPLPCCHHQQRQNQDRASVPAFGAPGAGKLQYLVPVPSHDHSLPTASGTEGPWWPPCSACSGSRAGSKPPSCHCWLTRLCQTNVLIFTLGTLIAMCEMKAQSFGSVMLQASPFTFHALDSQLGEQPPHIVCLEPTPKCPPPGAPQKP